MEMAEELASEQERGEKELRASAHVVDGNIAGEIKRRVDRAEAKIRRLGAEIERDEFAVRIEKSKTGIALSVEAVNPAGKPKGINVMGIFPKKEEKK
jgi:hypothetical protein